MLDDDNDSLLSVNLEEGNSKKLTYNKIEVRIGDLNIKKIIDIPITETIGTLKKHFISSLSTDLKDAMNFGLFLPSVAEKAGKFLLDERLLSEYGLDKFSSSVELRYKRRLLRSMNLSESRHKKLHSKANLKTFIEYVDDNDINKVSKMLNKGLDPNYQTKETGDTPLVKACHLTRPGNMIKTLVEGGAHLDFRHRNGLTPLHAAAIIGNLESVKVLLDLGQSPNTVDLLGLTPLYHATLNNVGAGCAERLLYEHSVVGIEDGNGYKEIHQACKFGHVQQLELLLQYNVSVNSQTNIYLNTPLHICAYSGHANCARLLLFRGADRSIVNKVGHTAYEQALLCQNNVLAKLIKSYKEENVVPIKSNAKYNEKRKLSASAAANFQRSCSLGKYGGEGHRRTQLAELGNESNVCLGKSIGKYSSTLNKRVTNKQSSAYLTSKRYSRSIGDLNDLSLVLDNLSRNPGKSVDLCNDIWDMNDGSDKVVDGSSSISDSKSELRMLGDVDTKYLPRMVALQRGSDEFGFVIRGIRDASRFNFVPSTQIPALQYLSEIDPNSVADRAGILKGDFILEINNQSVVYKSHEDTVNLIKSCGNIVAMKIITVEKQLVKDQRNIYDMDMDEGRNSPYLDMQYPCVNVSNLSSTRLSKINNEIKVSSPKISSFQQSEQPNLFSSKNLKNKTIVQDMSLFGSHQSIDTAYDLPHPGLCNSYSKRKMSKEESMESVSLSESNTVNHNANSHQTEAFAMRSVQNTMPSLMRPLPQIPIYDSYAPSPCDAQRFPCPPVIEDNLSFVSPSSALRMSSIFPLPPPLEPLVSLYFLIPSQASFIAPPIPPSPVVSSNSSVAAPPPPPCGAPPPPPPPNKLSIQTKSTNTSAKSKPQTDLAAKLHNNLMEAIAKRRDKIDNCVTIKKPDKVINDDNSEYIYFQPSALKQTTGNTLGQ